MFLSMEKMVAQRVIITFAKGNEVKFISHLDLMRLWIRALNRAGISLAYSQGFSPHPKIVFAAPLAVGVTSECEMLDLQLEIMVPPEELLTRLAAALPPGIVLLFAREIPVQAPSLPSRVRLASYRVKVASEMDEGTVKTSIERITQSSTLPRTRIRDGSPRSYDLRPLVDILNLDQITPSETIFTMTLKQDNTAAGRPEEVIAELGFSVSPLSIHRRELIFSE